jgi:hypothetical protein
VGTLILLMMIGCGLVLGSLLVVKVALQVFLGLALLPFKIVGGLLKGVAGLVGGLFGLLFSGAFGLLFLFVGLGVALLLPLLPFLIVGGLVWLAARASRPVVRPI